MNKIIKQVFLNYCNNQNLWGLYYASLWSHLHFSLGLSL